jgi:hypothetical protein
MALARDELKRENTELREELVVVKEQLKEVLQQRSAVASVATEQSLPAWKTVANSSRAPVAAMGEASIAAAVEKQLEERDERLRRASNVRVQGLDEQPGETSAILHEKVSKLVASLRVGEHQFVAHRVVPRASSAQAHAQHTGNRPRGVVVRFSSAEGAADVLRAKRKLQGTRFQNVFLEQDLTPLQMRAKAAAYPSFVAARKEGWVTRWEGEKVMVRDRRGVWVPFGK